MVPAGGRLGLRSWPGHDPLWRITNATAAPALPLVGAYLMWVQWDAQGLAQVASYLLLIAGYFYLASCELVAFKGS